ncbi:RNA polymerase subunit sigma-24 [Cupriavidus sp. USMAA2-4]|uniref:RNA polymerase subunit sigma-24 n=1 Tax=Cupriavidus malaysiensis TaxID=367825 RepID=A0ABM6F3K5_9BURK|nr:MULTISPECIES: sigma-70 family RNA polymerase sigma factor [Cupriavidus]AOY91031.1 RNA polymerase subunit sigma-24 [Cupriavidus sp. USMAA2-4]AOY99395.1 RNA polymerase subunit sigma-24 [Cupriavidus sp. USMAHM13]AOZ06012.1 RNA polymerase subunit sigma-24 [Cupriavidus malaysiensis]
MPSRTLRALGLFAYYEELVNTWTRKLSNRHAAEDLTQDALLRVLEAKAAPEQARAYLHRTARNLAIDAFRQQGGRESLALDSIESHPATCGDPEAECSAVQFAAQIEAALAELPLKCRQVFVWQRLDGCSQQEIAERLGVSKNMVEKYMIRAMRHLRDRVGALGPH